MCIHTSYYSDGMLINALLTCIYVVIQG